MLPSVSWWMLLDRRWTSIQTSPSFLLPPRSVRRASLQPLRKPFPVKVKRRFEGFASVTAPVIGLRQLVCQLNDFFHANFSLQLSGNWLQFLWLNISNKIHCRAHQGDAFAGKWNEVKLGIQSFEQVDTYVHHVRWNCPSKQISIV